jgi:hypothetical protein
MNSRREGWPDAREVFKTASSLASKGETRGNWDDMYFVGISETPEGEKSRVNIHHSKSNSGDYISIDKEGEYRLSVRQSTFTTSGQDEYRMTSDFVVPSDLVDVLLKLKPDSATHAKWREDYRDYRGPAPNSKATPGSNGSFPRTVLSKLFPLHSKTRR